MKIYNENKSREEVIEFVKTYSQSLLSSKTRRIHTIMNLTPTNAKVLGCGWGVNAIEMVKKEIW